MNICRRILENILRYKLTANEYIKCLSNCWKKFYKFFLLFEDKVE